MKIKRILPIMLSFAILMTTIAISSLTKPASSSVQPQKAKATADSQDEAEQEMRGVWITYMELSMESEADKSEKAFTEKFKAMAEKCKSNGFNTLIVQVRPFCDALYQSKLFPYSHILTGVQGKNPNYDALQIMCEICDEYGLNIHAWVNPYRVKISQTPSEFSDDNPYVQQEELCIETESGIFLDPSNEESRRLIVDGISEIIENYDVDGIQFDDYFYPTDIGDEDSEQYESYVNSVEDNAMPLETWRKFNVNMLIAEAYMAVHKSGKSIVFGISPQGNLGNNKKLSADVVNWCCAKGFADYICPQVYFSLDNPKLGFEDALDDWTNLDFADNVKLYIGLAGYKAGTDADEETWLDQDDILSQEYRIIKQNESLSGFMLYSYSSLTDETAETEIEHLLSNFN